MVGATITSPKPNTRTTNAIIKVVGTCEPNATVVIRTNGTVAGSTHCSAEGTFQILIQLLPGRNELTALNYDSLGEVGPETPSVLVIFETDSGSPPQPPTPPLPSKPESCSTYVAPAVSQGGRARILVVCMPAFMESGKTYELGILIWGGIGPYAVSVDWGDPGIERSLYSFKTAGYHTLEFTYQRPGTYVASISLSDQTEYAAFTQAALVISGETSVFGITGSGSSLNTSWFYSNVPLYLLLVMLVLGFWLGSLYGKHFRG